MNCTEWFDRLYQILDKDLDEASWHELEAHMKACQACWNRYEFEVRLKERVKDCCQGESCTTSLRVRIKAIFEK